MVLGFALFMVTLPRRSRRRTTDAIVVLTGGAGRIDRGLDLIAAHAGAAHADQRRRAAACARSNSRRPYRAPVALFACCIDLGREAVDTRSNAEETARWVHGARYQIGAAGHLRLAHGARAAWSCEAALGGDVSVVGDGVPSNPPLGLLIIEYNKLLLRRVALWIGIGV